MTQEQITTLTRSGADAVWTNPRQRDFVVARKPTGALVSIGRRGQQQPFHVAPVALERKGWRHMLWESTQAHEPALPQTVVAQVLPGAPPAEPEAPPEAPVEAAAPPQRDRNGLVVDPSPAPSLRGYDWHWCQVPGQERWHLVPFVEGWPLKMPRCEQNPLGQAGLAAADWLDLGPYSGPEPAPACQLCQELFDPRYASSHLRADRKRGLITDPALIARAIGQSRRINRYLRMEEKGAAVATIAETVNGVAPEHAITRVPSITVDRRVVAAERLAEVLQRLVDRRLERLRAGDALGSEETLELAELVQALATFQALRPEGL